MTLWTERDLPILKAFADFAMAGKDRVSTDAIAEVVGHDSRDVWIGLLALKDAAYLTWTLETNPLGAGVRVLSLPRVLEKGLRELQHWPSDSYTALIAILETRIKAERDPEERGRLERFKDGLLGMSRDVATDLLSALLRDVTGLR